MLRRPGDPQCCYEVLVFVLVSLALYRRSLVIRDFCRATLCIARPMPRRGVRLSVTFVYSVKTNNTCSNFFYRRNCYGEILTGSPLTAAVRVGQVRRVN